MIARQNEARILQQLLYSPESEFVTIIGRRRVGKTYLVREVYGTRIVFEVTGIQDGTMHEQLHNFRFSMDRFFVRPTDPEAFDTWLDAFRILIQFLETAPLENKPVIFIDELPWIATSRSDFMKGLSFFWNSWAVKNKVILVVCGSAASWMIQKLLLNKGGLHNRVTRQIYLQAFSLPEVKLYLQSRSISFDLRQLAQLYMVLGGIPYYLRLVPRGISVPQIVNYLLFEKNAPLRFEFDNLYQALFNSYEKYIAVVRACHSKWKGVTQSEIVRQSKLPSGGSLTRILKDLEASGFISSFLPFDKKKKETLYRLTDQFSSFYLKFLESNPTTDWQTLSQTQSFKSWLGFAFESLCLQHIAAIKYKLGISGVHTREFSFVRQGNSKERGAQIDLIIDRNDDVINLCEIKYDRVPYVISKSYKEKLREKREIFRNTTNTRKTIQLTLITPYGVKPSIHSQEIVDSEVILADLLD